MAEAGRFNCFGFGLAVGLAGEEGLAGSLAGGATSTASPAFFFGRARPFGFAAVAFVFGVGRNADGRFLTSQTETNMNLNS